MPVDMSAAWCLQQNLVPAAKHLKQCGALSYSFVLPAVVTQLVSSYAGHSWGLHFDRVLLLLVNHFPFSLTPAAGISPSYSQSLL